MLPNSKTSGSRQFTVLAKEKTNMLVEQNKEPRNKHKYNQWVFVKGAKVM